MSEELHEETFEVATARGWSRLAEAFGHRHRVPRGKEQRVPLRELKRLLPTQTWEGIESLELTDDHAVLVDLHGERAAPAKQRLRALGDAPLWVVSTGKGKGVMRAVLREVVRDGGTHQIVRWAGDTPQRPVPALAVVVRDDLVDAVNRAWGEEMEDAPESAATIPTWWLVALVVLLVGWAVCGG